VVLHQSIGRFYATVCPRGVKNGAEIAGDLWLNMEDYGLPATFGQTQKGLTGIRVYERPAERRRDTTLTLWVVQKVENIGAYL
jgi:hypothetical protein